MNYLTINSNSYHQKEGKIYFQNYLLEKQPDLDGFIVIDDWHAKDKKHVYNMMEIMPDADPASYELLSSPLEGSLPNRFSKDKKSVYFERNKLAGADPYTFVVLDEFHGKDTHRIYMHATPFEYKYVDFDSFEALGANYSKDSKHVYYHGNILDHADPDSFMVFEPGYWGTFAKDNTMVFDSSAQALPDVDTNTFKPIKGTLYGRDKQSVYEGNTALPQANPDSFTIIDDNFTHDDSKVYCRAKQIVGADVASFKVLTEYFSGNFSKDKNHIYYDEKVFPIVGSIDSFDPLNGAYCKDDITVYYDGDALEDVDLKSFTILGAGFARDNNTLYYYAEKQTDVDLASFELASEFLATDKNHVYWMMEKVEGLDPNTLEFINEYYIKDAKHIAYIDERFGEFELIEGADSASFTLLEKPFSKDKKHVYYCSNQLPLCDPDSFEIIGDNGVFSKDKIHIYYADEFIKEADRDTFTPIDYRFAKDKNHIYIYAKKIENSDPVSFHFIELPYVENRPNYALMPEYAKDNNLVYHNEEVMVGIHAQSFELISTWFAKDKNNIYSDNRALELDPKKAKLLSDLYISDGIKVFFSSSLIEQAKADSFEIISNGCHLAKDAQHVYFRENIIEGADSQSFYMINDSHCRDSKHNYAMRHGEWIMLSLT